MHRYTRAALLQSLKKIVFLSTLGILISAPAVRVGRAGVGGVEGEAYKSSPMDTVLYSLRRVDSA